jgi:hypothetical protein
MLLPSLTPFPRGRRLWQVSLVEKENTMRHLSKFFFLFLVCSPAFAAGKLATVEILDRAAGHALPV